MALPKQIIVKETLKELNALLKNASPLIGSRIRVFIEIKERKRPVSQKGRLLK